MDLEKKVEEHEGGVNELEENKEEKKKSERISKTQTFCTNKINKIES